MGTQVGVSKCGSRLCVRVCAGWVGVGVCVCGCVGVYAYRHPCLGYVYQAWEGVWFTWKGHSEGWERLAFDLGALLRELVQIIMLIMHGIMQIGHLGVKGCLSSPPLVLVTSGFPCYLPGSVPQPPSSLQPW